MPVFLGVSELFTHSLDFIHKKETREPRDNASKIAWFTSYNVYEQNPKI